MEVTRWMTKNPVVVDSKDSLATVRRKMDKDNFHRVPVVDDGKLVGIVSDRDVRTHLSYLESTTVRQAMTTPPLTVTPGMSIVDAARILRERKVGALPVLQDDRLVGMISTTDLLTALVEGQ